MNKKIAIISLMLLILALSQRTPISAETTNPRAACQALDIKQGSLKKVGFQLATTYCGEYTLINSPFSQTGRQTAPDSADNPLLTTITVEAQSLVVIDAVANGDSNQLLAELETLGLQHGVAFGPVVSGYLPISAIGDAAALSTLNFARPAVTIKRVGNITSQGDPSMQTDDFRTTHGIDGSGITIGTLSDSYDCQNGAAGDVSSNDLPAGIINLQEEIGCNNGSDEGRAMMQLIHDVAPGSSQIFHSAFNGQADFAQGIIDLHNAGADVIVDDVGYFAEPFYQDGIISQAVDTVVSNGTAYFSSAGNAGRNAYESAFDSAGIFAINSTTWQAHGFNNVDQTQQITVPVGESVQIIFQWASPYASANVGSGGAITDLDIFITTPIGIPIAGSDTTNAGGDPIEIFTFTNDGSYSSTTFNIMIGLFSGPEPALLKYNFSGSSSAVTIDEYATNSGTSYGHSIAARGISVGAAFYGQTPEFGTNPPVIESFSSAGGQRILYDANDNPVNIQRQKPEFVAPDGTNTTFFGQDIGADADAFPNFFGTSAAAPHAAAFAALILDQDSGSLTPQQVYDKMSASAVDMGPAGFDFDSGVGLIQASNVIVGAPTSVNVQTQQTTTQTQLLVYMLLGSLILSVVVIWLRPKSALR